MVGHPQIVWDNLGIHGVHGYSDTGSQSWVDISSESPKRSTYP